MNEFKEALVGKKVKRVFMDENYLKFETDLGNVVFEVDGDCCSRSVFYDFIGVKNLLNNGSIKSFETVNLDYDENKDAKKYQEAISVYGYRLITESPEFGEVSSVFSFRNYSNGYYGGSMYLSTDKDVSPEIFDDVIETVAK